MSENKDAASLLIIYVETVCTRVQGHRPPGGAGGGGGIMGGSRAAELSLTPPIDSPLATAMVKFNIISEV